MHHNSHPSLACQHCPQCIALQLLTAAACRYGLTSIPPAQSMRTEPEIVDADESDYDSEEDDAEAFWAAQEARREGKQRQRRVRLDFMLRSATCLHCCSLLGCLGGV